MFIRCTLTDDDLLDVALEMAGESSDLQVSFLMKFLGSIEDQCGTRYHYDNQIEDIAYCLDKYTLDVMSKIVEARERMDNE